MRGKASAFSVIESEVPLMEWVFDDGGRKDAGYKGFTGDCACRACAIVTGRPYKEVYDLINELAKSERKGKRKTSVSSARTGVYSGTMKKVMAHYGFKWVPTMHIGSGCTVHLNADELPSGKIVCLVSKHYVSVIDGVIHDTYDSSIAIRFHNDASLAETDRCVYGYFVEEVK